MFIELLTVMAQYRLHWCFVGISAPLSVGPKASHSYLQQSRRFSHPKDEGCGALYSHNQKNIYKIWKASSESHNYRIAQKILMSDGGF